jgi:acetylornithine deacetylase/succinyl-diaminopimelate desuccinylase-like protein
MKRDLSFQRAVRFAAELIRIPSLPGEEEEVALRIMEELRALGFDDVAIDRAGNVVGRTAGTGGASPVMLSSHMDVVDGDPATWEYEPYGARSRAGACTGAAGGRPAGAGPTARALSGVSAAGSG